MNHSITALEEMSMNAQPSLQTLLRDGWVLRFNNGYTKRANSVQPIYYSTEDIQSKIIEMESFYLNRGLPVVYKMTEQVYPIKLDVELDVQGYEKIDDTSVQVMKITDKHTPTYLSSEVIRSTECSEEWLNHYITLNEVNINFLNTLKKMLDNIIPSTYYVLVKEGENVVACGLGVLQNKYIGLFDIVTHPEYRRKGYGKKLIDTILHWGKTNGAEFAYLQVMLENKGALRLYEKLGFKEEYQYWYRRKL